MIVVENVERVSKKFRESMVDVYDRGQVDAETLNRLFKRLLADDSIRGYVEKNEPDDLFKGFDFSYTRKTAHEKRDWFVGSVGNRMPEGRTLYHTKYEGFNVCVIGALSPCGHKRYMITMWPFKKGSGQKKKRRWY